jgi:hypothetical protein
VVYGFSGAARQGGSSGGMASLLYVQGRSRDPFHLRAEAGWGGKPGRFRASAQVDAQQDDATLELIYRDTPELARLLAELGLEVRTPEDLERLLRELTGPAALSARTDSSGRFTFAGQDGAYTLAVDPASLPPGYELGRLAPRRVRLVREAPVREEVVVRAFRSISGTLRIPAASGKTVWLQETRQARVVGSDGRFVFRNLAPGRYTVVAETDRGFVERVIDVPRGPAAIQGVDFGAGR